MSEINSQRLELQLALIDREANRAKSRADFRNKIKICESEASETQFWLEVITEMKWLTWEEIKIDYEECSKLLALFTSIGSK